MKPTGKSPFSLSLTFEHFPSHYIFKNKPPWKILLSDIPLDNVYVHICCFKNNVFLLLGLLKWLRGKESAC